MKRTLVFLTCTVEHKKFRDRLQAAIDAGYRVVVIGIRQNRNCGAWSISGAEEVDYYVAQASKNMGLIRRLFLWPRHILGAIKVKNRYGSPDVILANTAEFVIIATIVFGRAKRKIYDLADVNPIQYGGGFIATVFRFIESRCLRVGWEVVVTSPWFYWGYLLSILKVDLRCSLIENRLVGSRDSVIFNERRECSGKDTISIGWSGVLRCNTSFGILLSLCELAESNYELYLIGVVDQLDECLLERARSLTNVHFEGEYREEELGERLKGVDFLWAADLSDGLNSRLLVPNRLYQGVFYSKPLIAFASTATGSIVGDFGLGVVLDDLSPNAISTCLSRLPEEQYLQFLDNARSVRGKVLRGSEWRDYLVGEPHGVLPTEPDVSVMFQ